MPSPGLLEDDHVWDLVMEDARKEKLPRQMRDLFIVLLAEVNLSGSQSTV